MEDKIREMDILLADARQLARKLQKELGTEKANELYDLLNKAVAVKNAIHDEQE